MKVAIVQPWLPQYRIEFYKQLKNELGKYGIDLDIYIGSTPPEWRDRNDSLTASSISTHLSTKFFRVGSQHLIWHNTSAIVSRKYDLIILEQAVRNLETYSLLLRYPGRIAFWGHGKTYTKSVPKLQETFKQWLTRRGSWFFGYTEESVDAVVAAGFSPKRTTNVCNTIDTTTLEAEIARVTNAEIVSFRGEGNTSAPLCLALGAIDDTKRIGFLIRAARMARQQIPSLRLAFAGDGALRSRLEDQIRGDDWISILGPTFGPRKAIALASSDLIVNPGRVGLVAVDSFASGTPIVTTKWPYHAPEFAYLRNGENAVISEDDEDSFACAISETLDEPERLSRLQKGCRDSASSLSIEKMALRFSAGVRAALYGRSKH